MRFQHFAVPEPRMTGWCVECGGVTYRLSLPWEGPVRFLAFREDGEEQPFASIPYEDARFSWVACHFCRHWVRPESGRIRQTRTWVRQATILVDGQVQRIDLDELQRRFQARLAQEPLPIWCPVANLKEYPSPSKALPSFSGSKHFAPGAKVHCFPPPWGDGRKFPVLGHHRASHRLVMMVIPFRLLTNWRVELVYSPTLIWHLWGTWDWTAEGKEAAQGFVTSKENEQAYLAALKERSRLKVDEEPKQHKEDTSF